MFTVFKETRSAPFFGCNGQGSRPRQSDADATILVFPRKLKPHPASAVHGLLSNRMQAWSMYKESVAP